MAGESACTSGTSLRDQYGLREHYDQNRVRYGPEPLHGAGGRRGRCVAGEREYY